MEQVLGNVLGTCALQSNGVSNNLFGLMVQTLLAAQCSLSPPDLWPADHAPHALEHGLPEYDFIIVGAGTAGSVLANRLSENPDWQVLLIEAGGDPPVESEIPLFCLNLQQTSATWNHYAEKSEFASKALANGSYWPSGRILGGSSGVNAMLYVRGNKADYDEWEELGNPTWNWENVLQYFKKSEDIEMPHLVARNGGKYHATGGPMKIGLFYGIDPLKGVIVESAKQKGYKFIDDYNGDEHIGFTYAFGNIYRGARFSAAKGFLNSAKDRPNLHIIKNALATQIFVEDNRAKAIEFELTVAEKVEKFAVKAKKEVIVSAGSVKSSQLLQLSGIGPKSLLESFEIPVVKDAAVGLNLQDHVFVPIFFSAHKGLAAMFNPQEFADLYYQYIMHKVGLFSTMGITDVMGFVNTENKTALYPNIQYIFLKYDRGAPVTPELFQNFGIHGDARDILLAENQEGHVMQVCVTLLKQSNRGKIEIRSKDPHDPPKIFPNYLEVDQDVKAIVKGIRLFRELLDTDLFKHHKIEEIRLPFEECDTLEYNLDDYWTCYGRQLSTTLYHPVGTAKMGPDTDNQAVVDYRLRLKGVSGLRVIDASVMPIIPAGNTNAPTMMIAEKAADFIKEDWQTQANRDEL